MENSILASFSGSWNIISREIPNYLYVDKSCSSNGEPDFLLLMKRYGIMQNSDDRKDCPEYGQGAVFLGSADPLVRKNMVILDGYKLDPYTLQAIKLGALEPTDNRIENRVQALLHKDGYFLLSIREEGQAKKFNSYVDESVRWRTATKRDHITDAVVDGCLEKRGTQVRNLNLAGIFNYAKTTRQWVYTAVPEKPLDMLIEEHKGQYQDSYPEEIIKIPLTIDSFLGLISKNYVHNGKSIEMEKSLPTMLHLAGAKLFGKDFEEQEQRLSL